MRLHRLTMAAFGPFPDTVEVDFEALSAAGLFLLSGDNGAGKTTVLDAVCFALYGAVPGDRQTAKSLRCDLAAAGAVPRVLLEASLGGRRFRLERSPAWERPKKRGTGLTRQQPTAVVSEWLDGEWRTLTSRPDEAGHLVSELLGMNLTQFVQIALLPQGKFDAFLRSTADDRQRLLQKLFHTERFHRVEAWFRERRVQLHHASEAQQSGVVRLLSRVAEVGEVPLPEMWAPLPEDLAEVTQWLSELAGTLEALEDLATTSRSSAEARSDDAERALEAARVLSARQQRHAEALAEQAALAAHEIELARLETTVTLHRRSERLAPVLDLADRSRDELATTADRHAELSALAGACPSHSQAARAAGARAAELRAALPQELERAEQARLLSAAEAESARLTARLTELAAAIPGVQESVAGAEQQLADATAAAAKLPEAQRALEDTGSALVAARFLVSLRDQLQVAQAEAAACKERKNQAHEFWLHLREQRLVGIAAELAGRLAVGAECPVCGSHEHPQPARTSAARIDEQAEKLAQSAYDDAALAETAADHHVHELQTQIAVREQSARGRHVAALEREVACREGDLAVLVEAAGRREPAAAEVAAAQARLEAMHDQVARIELDLAVARAEVTATRQRITELCRRLDLLSPDGDSLTDLLVAAEDLERRHQAAAEAEAALARCEAAAAQVAAQVAAAAAEHGFADEDAARAARLPKDEAEAAERRLAAHAERVALVQRVLSDPDLQSAAELSPPDVAALEQAARSSRDAYVTAQSAADRATRARARVRHLSTEVQAALDRLEPVRQEWQAVAALAAFVEGKSPDNRLQMRLSAYVLAYRLGQVVSAANVRLSTMSDQRYALEHTAAKGAGDLRGGLSLTVRDDWSGSVRDPATLSGGETFVVSLALALGLADVISQEAGGSELETLFVDEGFGSLDAETLDHVLDTLDTLRDGGRVVGVVSHVPEMKDRITTHLHVEKARTGSVIR